MLWTIIVAIIVGAILGVIGRLIVPGRQDIPWWLTIGVGILAAFVGGWIYQALGGGPTSGIDWIKFLVQLVVAAIFVYLAAMLWGRRSSVT